MVKIIDSSIIQDEITSENPIINEDFGHPPPVVVEPTIPDKRRVIRNSVITGLAYFFYFTGFWALSNLESTIIPQQGLGVYSLAAITLCSMVSCFFPELLIAKFGTKTTYVVSIALSVPYIASNFVPRWDTMMISAVLCGLACGPLNAALTCYMDEMAKRFGTSIDEKPEDVEPFFFGLFMFFNEFTQVSGNVIAYYTLKVGRTIPVVNNHTETECGIHFLPGSNDTNTNLDPPSDQDRYMLIGIFVGLGVLAVVTALLLDPLGNDRKEVKGCYMVMQKVTSAAKRLKKPHQLLLLPITAYLGIESSFYSAEFTRVSSIPSEVFMHTLPYGSFAE